MKTSTDFHKTIRRELMVMLIYFLFFMYAFLKNYLCVHMNLEICWS